MVCSLPKFIELTAELPRVASGLGQFLLEPINFLNHGDWENNLVLFEPEQRTGIVVKYVGV